LISLAFMATTLDAGNDIKRLYLYFFFHLAALLPQKSSHRRRKSKKRKREKKKEIGTKDLEDGGEKTKSSTPLDVNYEKPLGTF
jgi:hypothetical protein